MSIKIGKAMQGHPGNTKSTKMGKLHLKLRQVDVSEILNTTRLVKY